MPSLTKSIITYFVNLDRSSDGRLSFIININTYLFRELKDALDANSFICPDMHIHSTMAENNGEQVASDWNKYDKVVEGTVILLYCSLFVLYN